jgi:hypothetical protein
MNEFEVKLDMFITSWDLNQNNIRHFDCISKE